MLGARAQPVGRRRGLRAGESRDRERGALRPGRCRTIRPRSRSSPTTSTPTSWSSGPRSRSCAARSTPSRAGAAAPSVRRAAAARLEGSKAWMKEVRRRGRRAHRAPRDVPRRRRGRRARVPRDTRRALRGEDRRARRGKGVVVTESIADARDAVRDYLAGAAFGDAGRTLVIEEGMRGPELSLLVVCNGNVDDAVPLAPAQDFKRIGDGDAGPNTGGMGAYSPVPIAGDRRRRRGDGDGGATRRCTSSRPRASSTEASSTPGSCSRAEGPKIVEYNVRFGDPECQVVVPRLRTDLAELCAGRRVRRARSRRHVHAGRTCGSPSCSRPRGIPPSPRHGRRHRRSRSPPAERRRRHRVPRGHRARRRRFDRDRRGPRARRDRVRADARRGAARAYEAAACISWPGLQYRRDIAEVGGRERA